MLCILFIFQFKEFIKYFQLFMADAPPSVFTQQPDGGGADVIGNTKVLLCSATTANGDPVSVYQWTKDGVPIPFPDGAQTTPLKFQGIQLSDAGLYQCIAVNSFGSLLSSKAQVTVACKYIITRLFSGAPWSTWWTASSRRNLPP